MKRVVIMLAFVAISDTAYAGDDVSTGRLQSTNMNIPDIFASHSWYTPPPPVRAKQRNRSRNTKPAAPKLPFSLLGTYQVEGEDSIFFLVKEDVVYDVTFGDTVAEHYRVEGVANGKLKLMYLPMQIEQWLDLGEVK